MEGEGSYYRTTRRASQRRETFKRMAFGGGEGTKTTRNGTPEINDTLPTTRKTSSDRKDCGETLDDDLIRKIPQKN